MIHLLHSPDRRLALPTNDAEPRLRDQVLTWLRDARWEIEDMKSKDGYRWLFSAIKKPGPYTLFMQPDDMPDGILIQCTMPVSDECRSRLLQRSAEAQEQFL